MRQPSALSAPPLAVQHHVERSSSAAIVSFERIAFGARLLAAVLVLVAADSLPHIGLLFVVTLAVFCVGYALIVVLVRARSRTGGDREWAERFTLTADLSLVAFALLVFAPDPNWAVYAAGFLVIASGGLRFRNGALLASVSLALAYIVVAIFRSADLGLRFEPLQFGLQLGSYLVAGVLMNAVLPELDSLRRRELELYEPVLRAQEDTGEALLLTHGDRPVYWNRAFEQLTGYSTADLDRRVSTAELIGDRDAGDGTADTFRTRLRRRDGGHVDVEVSHRPATTQDPEQAVWIFRDATEREHTEAVLREHAFHDALTALPNRALLADRLSAAIAVAQRQFGTLSVLLLDLDGFKGVNDRHGHAAGDRVLVEVATRIAAAVRESDTAARLGGDEFVVLLPSTALDGAHKMARALNDIIAKPIAVPNGTVTVGASIGVAIYPEHGRDPAALLASADAAMYEAKRRGCGWRSHDDAALAEG